MPEHDGPPREPAEDVHHSHESDRRGEHQYPESDRDDKERPSQRDRDELVERLERNTRP